MVGIKRAYEPATHADGYRVLVDRLWPRGIAKADLAIDEWARELAPSDALRRWFGHDATRWREFTVRYREELREQAARERLRDLARRAADDTVTLVYAAHDEKQNNAVIVRAEVARRVRSRSGRRR